MGQLGGVDAQHLGAAGAPSPRAALACAGPVGLLEAPVAVQLAGLARGRVGAVREPHGVIHRRGI